MIYFDYAATTPVDPRVAAKMQHYLTSEGIFANPASRTHQAGWLAQQAVEQARLQVAQLINAHINEIIWTSGATEAINLALFGYLRAHRHLGKHLITSRVEHKATLDCAQALEEEGFEITYLTPNANGFIEPSTVAQALRPATQLVSLMAVNNETGAINPLTEISRIVKAHGTALHIDAAQAVGKIAIDVQDLDADLLSLSAHKFYGPKGIGALYVRQQTQLKPLIYGGGHEKGLRSGTLATHQIVALGEAASLAQQQLLDDQQLALRIRQCLQKGFTEIQSAKPTIAEQASLANIFSVGFSEVDGLALLQQLDQLAVANSSACNSVDLAPSHVLTAMGLSKLNALATLRFSFGRFSTEQEATEAVKIIKEALHRLT